jgi:hypothetical protein
MRSHLGYWGATLFLAVNGVIAGTIDILGIQPFFGVLRDLGYPAYFGAILGTWKVLGALALVVPGYPRLKEWAYAGGVIDYTAAIVSYVAIGEVAASNLSGPILSVVLLVVSWALRPPSRRLPGPLV